MSYGLIPCPDVWMLRFCKLLEKRGYYEARGATTDEWCALEQAFVKHGALNSAEVVRKIMWRKPTGEAK